MSGETLLIIDDEESIRSQLTWALADEYRVVTAASAEEARRVMAAEKPSLVTLDVALSAPGVGDEGLELLEEIVDRLPHTKVVMVTGNDSRENALLALRRGAVDWYAKPIVADELRVVLRRALHVRNIERAQQPDRASGTRRYHQLIGESEPMRKVYALVQRVAPTDATVLVTGENGTGKELVANAIHKASKRAGGPFVPINCGAIPENLLEAEMFGHERGAFTDAHRSREGRFELADGGTLFLDEIGEMPTHLQVKLLRFLQDRRFERVGGRESLKVDVRVVAATNQDLKAAIAAGRFREDLFYRLSVVAIAVPPLRSREGDIAMLADYFLDFYSRHHNRKFRGFTLSARRALQQHAWPGNVRELENRVQRAVILATEASIRPEDLELAETALPEPRTLQEARDQAERALLVDAMTRNAGNVTRAAKDVGISRPTLHDLLRKHGLEAGSFRRPGAPEGEDEKSDEDEAREPEA